MTKITRKPPSGAPEGTVWFGGPIDRFKITLRIFGDDLDPDHITSLLQRTPTTAETKGKPIHIPGGATRIPNKGCWSLTIESKDYPEGDVEDGIRLCSGACPTTPKCGRL